jgi:hypothetical protein
MLIFLFDLKLKTRVGEYLTIALIKMAATTFVSAKHYIYSVF